MLVLLCIYYFFIYKEKEIYKRNRSNPTPARMKATLRPLGMRMVMDAPLPPGHDLKKLYSNLPPPPPSPTQANAKSKIGIDHWCQQLTFFIATGRLHCIDKIAAIIAHLEPRSVPILDITPDYLHLLPPADHSSSASSVSPSRLDQTEYLSTGLKPLSVQLIKNAKTKIVMENLFNWRAVSEVFKVVDPHRLSYANLYDAFDLDDLSLVLRPEWLPLTPKVGSVVLPFLLLVLYVKLATNTTGSDDVSILFSKLKRSVLFFAVSVSVQLVHMSHLLLLLLLFQPPLIDIPNMPAEVFLSALAERRVRFFESPALDQFGVERCTHPHPHTHMRARARRSSPEG
jgi:hypothetical protein